MATSGSFNTAAYTTEGKTRYLTFSWERTSYSVDKNTSTISYTLKGAGTYTGWINTRNIKLIVNGTTVYSAAGPIKVYNGTVLKSGTITISHNNDGTKSFSASAESGIYYSTVNSKGSGSWALNTIPRASTVKATNGNIGSKSTISITRASSNFTHTLTWSCSGLSGSIAEKTTNTTVEFAIPTSLYEKIPNDPSATVTVTCVTYNGTTPIGNATTCTFKATADKTTCKPDLTYVSVLDVLPSTKALTGGTGQKLVKGQSEVKLTDLKATAKNGAKIKSITFKVTPYSITSTYDAVEVTTSRTFAQVQSGTFTFTATDSRGYSTTITHTAEMYDYFKPSMVVKVQRTEQTGDKIKAEYSGKFYSGTISTGMKLEYCYKQDNGSYSAWSEIARVNANKTTTITQGTFTNSGNDFSGDVTLQDSFDYRKEHTLQFRVTDCLNGVSYTYTVVRGVPVFDWGENDVSFNVPVIFNKSAHFLESVDLDKPTAVDFVIEQGTKNVTDPNTNQTVAWGYRKWANGTGECWIRRSVSCNVTSAWGSALFYGTVSTINFPFKFAEVPVVNVTCEYATSTDNSLFIASCGFSSQNYARPIMLCRTTSGTFNCVLLYHVIGRYEK